MRVQPCDSHGAFLQTTECNSLGTKGCTAFTWRPTSTLCRIYKASGNQVRLQYAQLASRPRTASDLSLDTPRRKQGKGRLTFRTNTTAGIPDGTTGTTIYVKGTKRRALYGASCF